MPMVGNQAPQPNNRINRESRGMTRKEMPQLGGRFAPSALAKKGVRFLRILSLFAVNLQWFEV